jgi:hypothetical protein
MRVIETTARVGPDGILRLQVPIEQRDADVRVAAVVESAPPRPAMPLTDVKSASNDPRARYRGQLRSAGVDVPKADSWSTRQAEPLRFEGPPASQTLVEDRR